MSTEAARARFLTLAMRWLETENPVTRGRLADQMQAVAKGLDPIEVRALTAAARRQVEAEAR